MTLVGLVAKNGILIVEFANKLQEAGKTKLEAVQGSGADPPAADPDDQRRHRRRPLPADASHRPRRRGPQQHRPGAGHRHGGRHVLHPLLRARPSTCSSPATTAPRPRPVAGRPRTPAAAAGSARHRRRPRSERAPERRRPARVTAAPRPRPAAGRQRTPAAAAGSARHRRRPRFERAERRWPATGDELGRRGHPRRLIAEARPWTRARPRARTPGAGGALHPPRSGARLRAASGPTSPAAP